MTDLAEWRLCLVTDQDRCQLWMGTELQATTEPGSFQREQIGHFLLRGPNSTTRDLYPFLCYLPDAEGEQRLHFYDSIYRYQETRKEVSVLEYDNGLKHGSSEPVSGLEQAFTKELLKKAFQRHQGRMEVIEGRVANFGELLVEHADIVGRRFVIEHVHRFIEEHDRGLMVIQAEPGKGKTALMCHLIEDVFGHFTPQPVHFFYRRTAGITDPDVCVRSLYHALLQSHEITESEESQQQTSPDEVYEKLTNLLADSIAPRLSPSRPQLMFIDALDESDTTDARRTAFDRIPENLPAGMYVIATTRPISDRATLARRAHLHWYDLDSPDLLQDNLRDGTEYVRRELVGTDLPDDAVDEISRLGNANFLVLKLLVTQVRGRLESNEVREYIRRLATDCGQDQLGFIYKEFWKRLTNRLNREDTNLLCDMAGLLVTARAPLTREMICCCLRLRDGDWDFALRHLSEYLTVIEQEAENVRETYYRIYHESFADFLRSAVVQQRGRYQNLLAEYCLGWSELAPGRGRLYALRFAAAHLIAMGRWIDLVSLLTDLRFVEAKCLVGLTYALVADYDDALRIAPHREALAQRNSTRKQNLRDYAERLVEYSRKWNEATFRWRKKPNVYPLPAAGAIPLPLPPDSDLDPTEESTALHVGSEMPAATDAIRLNAFAAFTRTHCHCLSAHPAQTLLIARNHASDGPVAVMAERQVAKLQQVWVARDPRPRTPPMNEVLFWKLEGQGTGWGAVALTADGRHAVSGSVDGTLIVWDLEAGRQLTTLAQSHQGWVQAVAITPDGRFAMSADRGDLWVWDLATNRPLRKLKGHTSGISAVAMSPDGRLAVSTGGDLTMRVWDVEAGHEVWILEGHTCTANDVALNPDGRLAVSAGDDKTIRVWDLLEGRELWALRGHTGAVASVALSLDGRRVVSASADRTVRVWDIETGREVYVFRGHVGAVEAVALTADGQRAVTTDTSGLLQIWDLAAGRGLCKLKGPGRVSSLALTADGQTAVGSGTSLEVCERLATGRQSPLAGHIGGVSAVALTADGRRAVSGGSDGTVRVWETATGHELHAMKSPASRVTLVELTPDGRRAITTSQVWPYGMLGVWDLETGQELYLLEGHEAGVRALTVTQDGRRAISASDDTTLRVWDPNNGCQLHVLQGHAETVAAVAVTPDGRVGVSASWDETLRLWDLETGRQLRVLEGHSDWVYAVQIGRDGQTAVSASADGTVRAWQLATGRELHVLTGHEGGVLRLKLTSDGRRAVTVGRDHTIRVWDVAKGVQVGLMMGDGHDVHALELSPDGRLVVSVADDLSCRVWDLCSGDELATYVHSASLCCLSCILTDGRFACGTSDGHVHFLRLCNLPNT